MAKLSQKQLESRKAEMSARARASVAKTEVMQFRLDAESIQQLYELAVTLKKPVGAMVREWVLERLQAEISPDKLTNLSSKQSPSAKRVLEMQAELVEINSRVSALEKERKKRQSSK